jgi:hypothetical protein
MSRLARAFANAVAADLARGDRFAPMGRHPVFPCEVPPRQVLGLRDAPIGTEESTQCGRTYPGVTFCLGVLVNRPDESFGGCHCGAVPAPCSSCLSWLPECPSCGWRAEEAT